MLICTFITLFLLQVREIVMRNLSILRYGLMRSIAKLFKPKQIVNSTIDKTARISSGAQVVSCNIDRYTYINESTVVYTDIGAFCSIAGGCVIGGAEHPIDWASTSPVFCEGRNPLNKHFSNLPFEPFKRTYIGNDVWIGAHCLVKAGIHIGDGAIVGMGSVVTHDVIPYSIVAGNPARIIRKRFDDETIEFLLKIKWWNWESNIILKNSYLFNNIEKLIEKSSEIIQVNEI